jgi:hypothetical protein
MQGARVPAARRAVGGGDSMERIAKKEQRSRRPPQPAVGDPAEGWVGQLRE